MKKSIVLALLAFGSLHASPLFAFHSSNVLASVGSGLTVEAETVAETLVLDELVIVGTRPSVIPAHVKHYTCAPKRDLVQGSGTVIACSWENR